ncbi:uncharacterized protein [Amphiura filiformis]|uniref:uncharacterized protein isoform X1 n=1 Tax=Amphiura filiformis TaxID=82378 RepID=UPI003B214D55
MNKRVLLVLMAAIAYEVRDCQNENCDMISKLNIGDEIKVEDSSVPLCSDGCPANNIILTVTSESHSAAYSAEHLLHRLVNNPPTGFQFNGGRKYGPPYFTVGVTRMYLYYKAIGGSAECQCAFTITVVVGLDFLYNDSFAEAIFYG